MDMRYLAALLLVTTVALAQTPARLAPPARSTEERRQPADTQISASLTAHGGAQLLQVLTVRLRGKSTLGKIEEPMVVSASMEGSSRIDYGQPVTRSLVTTPVGSFEVRDGQRRYRPPHSGAYTGLDLFSVLSIRNTFANGANRGVVGMQTLNGREVFRAHVGTDRQQVHYGRVLKDEADIDLDVATGLVAAVHRRGHADEDLNLTFVDSYTFADYRDVNGIQLPFKIERYFNGRLEETITVDSFEINPIFDRGHFES